MVAATSSRSPISPTPQKRPATDILYNASATDIENALKNLSNIGSGNVHVMGSTGTADAFGDRVYTIEFQGTFAGKNVPTLTVLPGTSLIVGPAPGNSLVVGPANGNC